MRYGDIHEFSLEPKWSQLARVSYAALGKIGKGLPDFVVPDPEKANQLMKGAIDTHIHVGPDPYIPRSGDAIDVAIQACEMGMGAVVCKPNFLPTVMAAHVAQRVVVQWAKEHGKESTKVIGGITLGYPVGGLNPEAVRCAAKMGGRFVWTPIIDSSHTRRVFELKDGIEVIGSDDKVLPELREIFKIIAKYDMVLTLGHQSTRERFIMLDDAKEEGVKRISINHPTESLVKMNLDQMKMAAEKGAFLELCCMDFDKEEVIWDEWIEAIKEVGADHFILGTDCGNWAFPTPAPTYRAMLGRLLKSGIPEADIEKMAKNNPHKLIF